MTKMAIIQAEANARFRKVLKMRDEEGLKFREIAERLGGMGAANAQRLYWRATHREERWMNQQDNRFKADVAAQHLTVGTE